MVEIKKISFEDSTNVISRIPRLKNISLKTLEGTITSFIAPKNSGKTLLLKIIAGIETPTSGGIINAEGKKIVYIPGKPSSFPWLNVYENVSFGLSKPDEVEIKRIISLVGLEGYEKHIPNNKSYGFRFRISLARSLAHSPSLILLDEPFAQMDDITKKEIFQLIRQVSEKCNVSFLLAASNITEALFLSDKIYLMMMNPLEIFHEEDIKFPKERKVTLLKSEIFLQLCSQFYNLIKLKDPQNLFNISI
jgi:ABC-type nitrate/sulfonate/bicarbonate transport system ATPase subunit